MKKVTSDWGAPNQRSLGIKKPNFQNLPFKHSCSGSKSERAGVAVAALGAGLRARERFGLAPVVIPIALRIQMLTA